MTSVTKVMGRERHGVQMGRAGVQPQELYFDRRGPAGPMILTMSTETRIAISEAQRTNSIQAFAYHPRLSSIVATWNRLVSTSCDFAFLTHLSGSSSRAIIYNQTHLVVKEGNIYLPSSSLILK